MLEGLDFETLKSISSGIPAKEMPDQAFKLGSCDPTPDPANLMLRIEALEAKIGLFLSGAINDKRS